MIFAKHLSQENPQRYDWRIDAVEPNDLNRCHRLRDYRVRKQLAKRQVSILNKLLAEKLRLPPKPSVRDRSHRVAALPKEDVMTPLC